MTYFRFNAEHFTEDNFETNVSFESVDLFNVVENFKLFLRGVGYTFHDLELQLDDPEAVHEYNRHKFLDPEDEAFEQITQKSTLKN